MIYRLAFIKESALYSLISKTDKEFSFRKAFPKILLLITGMSTVIYTASILVRNKNKIFLGRSEFKKFEEFLKKENTHLNLSSTDKSYHANMHFGGIYINSLFLCISYAKYLISISKNHPLKGISFENIELLVAKSSSDIDDLNKITKGVSSNIPGLSNEIIAKYFLRNSKLLDKGWPTSKAVSETSKRIFFIDRPVLIDFLKKKASRELNKEVEVLEFGCIGTMKLKEFIERSDPKPEIVSTKEVLSTKFIAMSSDFFNKHKERISSYAY